MKIGYINPTYLIRRPLVELANHFEGTVIVPRPIFKKENNPWHNKLTCKVVSYPTIKIPFIQFNWPIPITPKFFIEMYKLFRDNDAVHMWTFFYISSWFAMFLKYLFPKTNLIMSCDTLPAISFKDGWADYLFKIYYKLFGWTFAIPDVIHAYTWKMAHILQRNVVHQRTIINPIPTGIDVQKFDKVKRDRGFKDKIYVTFAGEITPRKGVDRYIKTTKNLGLPFYFTSFGDGPDFNKHKGNSKKVIMHKWADDLPQVLKNSDVCILLSRGEGLPGILMEAMACKLPIIATDITGNNDLVEHGKTGFLIKQPEDVKVYLDVLKDPVLRKELGKEGYKKIKKYDWKHLWKEYEVMYK